MLQCRATPCNAVRRLRGVVEALHEKNASASTARLQCFYNASTMLLQRFYDASTMPLQFKHRKGLLEVFLTLFLRVEGYSYHIVLLV